MPAQQLFPAQPSKDNSATTPNAVEEDLVLGENGGYYQGNGYGGCIIC